MRIVLASFTALVVSALLLSGCGDGGKAARATKIKALKAQAKALNAAFAEKGDAWSAVKVKVIPARGAWLRSKGTGDEAANKQAYDDANAEAQMVIDEEKAAQREIRDIEDEIARLEAVR
jgi:chromosome segregation ATPase